MTAHDGESAIRVLESIFKQLPELWGDAVHNGNYAMLVSEDDIFEALRILGR